MARQTNKLSALQLSRATFKPGLHADGGGLYLQVTDKGTRSWVFVYRAGTKRTEIGLGSARDVSLADARTKAAEYRVMRENGLDPKAAKRAEKPPTIKVACARFIESFGSTVSPRREKRWKAMFRLHLGELSDIPVNLANSGDISKRLATLQAETPIVATELRGLLERVFSYAIAQGHRTASNPANWKGNLAFILPKLGKQHEHHPAMNYADCPAFFQSLYDAGSIGASALQFLMLTATRKDEARLVTWEEIDLESCIWTIPAERTKTDRALRVPLTAPALKILHAEKARRGAKATGLVFRGRDGKSALGHGSMNHLMRSLKTTSSVHGFRTAFRVWVAEQTDTPRDVAEMCLNHVVGSQVERAYQRSDLLDKRGELMKEWGRYLCSV